MNVCTQVPRATADSIIDATAETTGCQKSGAAGCDWLLGDWASNRVAEAHQSWHGCHEFSGTCCEVLQMLFVLAKDITYKREACRPPDELRHCVP